MKLTLEALVAQFDKRQDINKVPKRVLAMALAHPDEVAVVSLLSPLVDLAGMDLDEGYTLLAADFTDLYTEVDLEVMTWGTTASDAAWLYATELGDYAYLAYVEQGTGAQRVVMLIRG